MTRPTRWAVAIAFVAIALGQAVVGESVAPATSGTRTAPSTPAPPTSPAAQAATAPATPAPGDAGAGTAVARVRIYPLGDSITYGVFVPGGYRLPLSAALTASGIAHEMVGASTSNSTGLDGLHARHNGHPGFRIDQDAAGLDGRAGPSSDLGGHWLTGTAGRRPIHPDVTVIHLGTNDINQRYDPGTTYAGSGGKADLADPAQRATFVRHAAARLQALVDKLQALRPRSRVVLSNLVPIDEAPFDATVAAYNAHVARIAAAERRGGARVVLADVWSAFTARTPDGPVTRPGLLMPDTVHPTRDGYVAMATVYRDAVAEVLALR